MRVGIYWVGFAGGVSVLSAGACFYGPTWPPSIERGTSISAGSENTGSDGGVADAGDAGDAELDAGTGGNNFACNPPTDPNCQFFRGVPDAEVAALQTGCTAFPTCNLTGGVAGCCVVQQPGYLQETCYPGGTTMATIASTCAGGTITSKP